MSEREHVQHHAAARCAVGRVGTAPTSAEAPGDQAARVEDAAQDGGEAGDGVLRGRRQLRGQRWRQSGEDEGEARAQGTTEVGTGKRSNRRQPTGSSPLASSGGGFARGSCMPLWEPLLSRMPRVGKLQLASLRWAWRSSPPCRRADLPHSTAPCGVPRTRLLLQRSCSHPPGV